MNRQALPGLALVAGLFPSAALAQSFIEWEVSPATAESWSTSINAVPGQTIDIRARVSYEGTLAPLGLGSFFFQPTVSNWLTGSDILNPFRNDGGNTIPRGDVPDLPGMYGRIVPFGTRDPQNPYIGHSNTVAGVNYLRIAQSQVTNWIGQAGNTSGGSGVVIGQFNPAIWSTVTNPPPFFESRTQDLTVFKFSITLSDSNLDARTLIVDAVESYASTIGFNQVMKWYMTPAEPLGSLQLSPTNIAATIHVIPAPGSFLLFAGACAFARRRR